MPTTEEQHNGTAQAGMPQNAVWSSNGRSNVAFLKDCFQQCEDVIFYTFELQGGKKATLCYLDGLTDSAMLDEHIIEPLKQRYPDKPDSANVLVEDILRTVTAVKVTPTHSMEAAMEAILAGLTLLIPHRSSAGFTIDAIKFDKRGVSEPSAESVVRGPRDGFVETLQTNAALLRRRVRTPRLKMESLKRGELTLTEIRYAYIEGIVAPQLLAEVRKRLEGMSLQSVLDSGYVEECLEDMPASPFPQLLTTERPDVAASHLLEGRIVILVDGSPVALIAPGLWASFLQSPEDYYERHHFGTIIRWLRYICLVISLIGPSLYVAIITYHQEMIPTALILTMAKARSQVPFPALVEALLMEIMFEALREAGARLPQQVGSAISIVGALVIGQAAITAGLVSAPMVMVVAITGVSSFLVPHYNLGIAVRLLRFPMMILSGMLGMLGLMMGIILLMTHLFTLRSFGIPYMSGIAPMRKEELKDIFLRVPVWTEDTQMERGVSARMEVGDSRGRGGAST
ncbi:spore germination protein [Paenibacillus alvei]|uniref:spore germination protein n=1 Tax=Paenibacillus alvei TaxID=44250 RepID=UPI000287A3E2|nr:spore germination protein [Paenibacillus alvei]EJW19702.1 spore germination protein KA [Paenibacillus alvei DSM 29]MCY9540737.1 spore germination protein [Paenibacillus alvei]MCY9703000.1 spore germination protein [Paenibacillus alvei]MCY9734581.1 spore germination protein [Paenibacillus alvei]MCY9757625.1 spore germination protein [Paenibacillus alvei]